MATQFGHLASQQSGADGALESSRNKFAITSGAKSVCVCYYEAENNWWVSKLIKKKHESTVTAVAWHPSNVIIATASTDSKCRVFTAQVKGVDDDQSCAEWLSEDARFGDCLFEVSAESWIHAAVWSPSGTSLAFAAYNLSIGFVDGLHGPASGWVENLRPTRYVELPEGKLPMPTSRSCLTNSSSPEGTIVARR